MHVMSGAGGARGFSARKSKRTVSFQRVAGGFQACGLEPLENRLYLASAAYAWQNVNIGAGGYVDGVYYDPINQNVLYARTDVGGLYKSTNDGGSWNQLLNWVGNNTNGSGNGTQYQEFGVQSFAIDPENSNNIYADVGMYSGTDGDLLYSNNAGATWSTTPLSFWVGGNSNGRGDGEQIQVDPNDSNIIFLGSNANGLWESTNAGQSFSQVTSFSPTSTTFVLFNSTGTKGSPSQTIYVGIDSTSSGTNLYQTTNAGTSWSQITGSGSLPSGYLPGHAVISGGYIYLGYANAEAPNGDFTNGGVYRYQISTGTWANITPKATNGSFGYDAIAADPNNPNTIVVASFNYYSGPDQMWRTTNANAASPTWYDPYDIEGYGGFNTTRNFTAAPWTAVYGDGIGNWVDDIAIDPFNSNQLIYGGITATNNISNSGANTTITAANSWYFAGTGISMTAVLGLAAPAQGVGLISALGDINGFDYTTLTSSPVDGGNAANISGGGVDTMNSIDFAGTNPNVQAIVGSTPDGGAYTTNDGATWTSFASHPGTNGDIVVSANGSTFVWEPNGSNVYYSANNGSSWTESTLTGGGALPTGGVLVSDKVNTNYIYYWTENSNDNSWTLYISSNAGQTFAESADGSIGTGNVDMVVSPYVAGQIWISTYIGLYESTDFGASFNHVGSWNISASNIALGAAAPGSSFPAIYIDGTLTSGGFGGIYRSDDGGNTWLLLNNVNEQWGGSGSNGILAADPNVFGRVYDANAIGNPANSLPTGWSDLDINTPGNPGWATNSTTLSTGTVSNAWNIVGGGAGLSAAPLAITSLSISNDVAAAVSSTANNFQVGQMVTISGASNPVYDGTFVITGLANTAAGLASDIGAATEFTFNLVAANGSASGTITATLNDQFNYAYEPITGNVAASAQLTGMTNADNGHGTPQAGVMIRASTNPDDPFFEIAQTTAGNLVLEYRTTTAGSVTTQTLGGIPVGSEYLQVVRSGSNFSAYYSSNGTSWTQLGSTIAISAMPTTANVGLASTAQYNPQLTDATFTNVVVIPTPIVSQAAAANPSPVTGTSTNLTVLGAENGLGSGLTYTWSYTGPTGVTYSGNTNGTSSASSITANFTQAGTYNFTAMITDANNFSTTSSVQVIVNQTLTSIAVSPSNSPVVAIGFSQQFSATATDQFGNSISSPSFTWGITGSGNSISSSGDATLGSTPGSFTVSATDGSAQGNATVIAENFAVPNGATLDINLGAAGPVTLTASGGNITASQNGVQITLSGFTAVLVTDTGSNDVLDFNGPLALPFSFMNAAGSTVNVLSGLLNLAANGSGNLAIGDLSISNGASAAIASNTGTMTLDVLSIGGTLDITNNDVLINYGSNPDPESTILGYLSTGSNLGAWNGSGIVSSTAANLPSQNYGVGFSDGADGIDPSLVSGQIEAAYVQYGDITLQGLVNAADFHILASSFGQITTLGWEAGDFLYGGVVNAENFHLLAGNFGQTGTGEDLSTPAAAGTPVSSSIVIASTPQPANIPSSDHASRATSTEVSSPSPLPVAAVIVRNTTWDIATFANASTSTDTDDAILISSRRHRRSMLT